ncbi:MAG: hypothetical protein LiPW39_208 [Parcubacteria group bacterium LiPW_39]|nr:MAG: hypothetical protein LiPW39_208 [Parcubacteria group bacterium LiPW_39]
MGPLAILFQFLAMRLCQPASFWSDFFTGIDKRSNLFFLNIILFAPLIEEYLKYAVVKWRVLKNPAFDEPLDAMLYLIISALGFAAVENLLNIFMLENLTLQTAISQSAARFLSATLLHTLSSGILGYFLAQSLLNFKRRRMIFWGGFGLAVVFHGFYNYLAWLLDFDKFFIVAMAALLVLGAGLVGWQWHRLKKQLAICKTIREV